jgi:hypothetical protein
MEALVPVASPSLVAALEHVSVVCRRNGEIIAAAIRAQQR